MEWVEATAKSLTEAQEIALDRLGVDAVDAEFDIIEEPRPGLFGRTRGQARLRARVKPTPVRAKNERRRRSSKRGDAPEQEGASVTARTGTAPAERDSPSGNGTGSSTSSRRRRGKSSSQQKEQRMNQDESPNEGGSDERATNVTSAEVAAAAVTFMDGLVAAFGVTADVESTVDGTEIDVRVSGEGLGLLVGPAGGTLNAVQDVLRVAAQRRLGDHETRLRVDVAGYRKRRQAALMRFAGEVATAVRASGTARVLEPMSSADRKVLHDALAGEAGVTSRSIGEDPNRKVIVEPVDIAVGDGALDAGAAID